MHHLRALRPHQWIKNFFVFAALVFSRSLTNNELVVRALLVFGAFSLLASAVYLINDTADYERDRVHPKKRNRPIASGKVKRATALVMSACLIPIGLGTAFWLNTQTGAVLAFYFVMNLTYSIWLKHVVLLDVFIIATGFLLRVTAGALAIEVGISPWLIICTFFIALFLAMCKRRHELVSLGEDAGSHRGILAEYSVQYLDMMVAPLAAMTVMSYALYTIDARVIARLGTDALVVTVPLVLFGVFRYLFLVHRQDQGGSPTEVVLTDRGMQGVILAYLGIVLVAIYYDLQLGLAGA